MQYVGDLSTIDLFVIFIFTLIIIRNKHRPTNYSKTGQLHFDKFYKNLNLIIPRFAIICIATCLMSNRTSSPSKKSNFV